jgi:exosortase A-associated hydrolase 2
MNASRRVRSAEPFFLKVEGGERFCLYHAPAPDKDHRGSFIYVHPFAEEMNKSRRMAALQSRAFASAGFGVLQIDLYGCGDSSGDFADASWETWKHDLADAKIWLENHHPAPVGLWGLRLGALLALDFAMESPGAVDRLVLWQPLTTGETFLTQFLRTKLASEMLAPSDGRTAGTKEMRAAMIGGESVEVAGYEVTPALAKNIDQMNAANLAVTHCPVHWLELVPEPGRPLPPTAARVATAWKQCGVDLSLHLVPGTAFWATQEIAECPTLLAATSGIFHEVPA